ncbi:MAG: DUF4278 domain-containing protein [Leptolyngbyaceae cyanobacterium]
MQMTYRGVTFRSLIAGSPTIETEQTGVFLGKPYSIKQPNQSFRRPAEALIYRGVRYTR